MNEKTTIVWFRQDLRTIDNPALTAAVAKGGPVIPVYIWAPHEEGDWAPGGASKWWLHHSLTSLKQDLHKLGLNLIFRSGDSLNQLTSIIQETQADAVFWNRRYEPVIIKRDSFIKGELTKNGIKVSSFNSALLSEPWTIMTKQATPYKVFTPYWSCVLKSTTFPLPLPEIAHIKTTSPKVASDKLESFELLPKIHWDTGLKKSWKPGAAAALEHLENSFDLIKNYLATRDRPDLEGVSKLSPYLHFGELSPRQIWHAVKEHFKDDTQADPFLRQLGWREFGHYLLYHFPKTPTKPLQEKFQDFKWSTNDNFLHAWQKGLTGYPLVDAGMRQLWHTGWMHNRVRMIVASFLVKDLLLPWQRGAEWFWDTLVDADLANNTLGWQWTAGCGADAAPYYRIFNPTTQGDKFDVTKEYVRTWVPELKNLSDKWIYNPSEAPPLDLHSAGIKLGKDYPYPIVEHDIARKKALELFQQLG